MYSGLLPKGLSEADLSSDEEEENPDETQKHQTDTEQNMPNDLTPPPSSVPPESCWPGVPQELCQKFKELQRERENQKMDKRPGRKRGKKQHRKGGTCKQTSEDAEEKNVQDEVQLNKLQELTQYFGTNDRFQPPACSRPSPKSGLEKSMERAIAEGDYGKAEELSNRLATRELAVKIAKAVDCRDFARARREEEESRAARKKRKQIAWGFEAKKRWETKSNMGYM